MKKLFLNLFGITIGSILVSISLSMFIIPNNFISGGISGLSLIIFYQTGIPISILLYLFNIPIVALGAKYVGKTFALYSVAGITLMSSFVFLFRAYHFPSFTTDPLLASIFAGVITGLGGGIVFQSGGTLGGTDILATIAKKKLNISIGSFLLGTNIVVMILSLFFKSPQIIMYTLISMYVSSKVTDSIQEGINTKTTVMIISDFYEEIANCIITKMHRGVTYLQAEGCFLQKETKVILCILTRFELSKLKEITLTVDKNAFISISEAKEVFGKGF
jgi:uncharacterized membrane-anchored protein YitT (DUF2179 family)